MKETASILLLVLVAVASANFCCNSDRDAMMRPPRKSPLIAELSKEFEKGADQATPSEEAVPKEDILLELYALSQLGRLADVDATHPGRLDWKRKAQLEKSTKKKGTVNETPKPHDVNKQPEQSLQEKFDQAAKNVKKLRKTPKHDELVELYALFQQATIGDVNTADPGRWDYREKIKWDAWNHKKGTDSGKAKQDYANKVNELIGRFGLF